MAVVAPETVECGEVFTRRWVVETVLDLVGYTADRDLTGLRLVEPSIGSGAFLIPIVERLIASARAHGVALSELSGCLFGLDLRRKHVDVSRREVEALLFAEGMSVTEASRLVKTWLVCGDFLLDEIPGKADVVVGNPPYIRTEDLDDAIEKQYRLRWRAMRGRADIYIGFYERGLGLLAKDGKLCYICADRWMRNAYGKHLRALIASEYAVESVWQMHDVDAFEAEVSAYPAITALANTTQRQATVIDTRKTFNARSARAALAFVHGDADEAAGLAWEGACLPGWFETKDFWPTGSPHTIKLLERLQEDFPTLESDGMTKISIGVATGADKAYIIRQDDEIDVEPERLTPIVMADDIRDGHLKPPTKMLLNPWDDEGQIVDLAKYPKFAAILRSHKNVRTRFVAQKTPQPGTARSTKSIQG